MLCVLLNNSFTFTQLTFKYKLSPLFFCLTQIQIQNTIKPTIEKTRPSALGMSDQEWNPKKFWKPQNSLAFSIF